MAPYHRPNSTRRHRHHPSAMHRHWYNRGREGALLCQRPCTAVRCTSMVPHGSQPMPLGAFRGLLAFSVGFERSRRVGKYCTSQVRSTSGSSGGTSSAQEESCSGSLCRQHSEKGVTSRRRNYGLWVAPHTCLTREQLLREGLGWDGEDHGLHMVAKRAGAEGASPQGAQQGAGRLARWAGRWTERGYLIGQ